jgi:hypothetical protein
VVGSQRAKGTSKEDEKGHFRDSVTHENGKSYDDRKQNLRAPFAFPHQDMDERALTGITLSDYQKVA